MEEIVEKLSEQEERWITSIGAWFPGERVVFRGEDLHEDLRELTFDQIYYYAVTGKLFKDEQLFFLSTANTVCSSFPDPRLWNNRVAALAATARSPASLAINAANAVSDASVFGGHTQLRAHDFLIRAMGKVRNGEPLEQVVKKELKTYRAIAGFGRPVTNKDERVEALIANAKKSGIVDGEYLAFAFEIDEFLSTSRYRFNININGVLAAMMADQGITPWEFYLMAILTFSAGIGACYVDSLEHEEGAFFPLNVERISYQGESVRSW